MTLGSRLKQLREDRKMNQAELGKILGVSNVAISHYERDARKPTPEQVSAIASLFGVSTDWLLGQDDANPYWHLSNKEKIDIGKEVDRLLDGMTSDAEVNFYGEPMTDEDKASLKAAIQMAMELNKQKAKQHFTPKKYRN